MLKKGVACAMSCIALATSAVAGGASHAQAALPDDRAYELVSPPGKDGGGVAVHSQRTRAALDGSAASFVSLVAFGDAVGTSTETEYLSRRDETAGTRGWSTHAITPRQEPLALTPLLKGLGAQYVAEFSDDLSQGVFKAWSPLTGDADVANVENLYVREDLRTPGVGDYTLLSACPACAGTPLEWFGDRAEQPFAVGASADFKHVVFESNKDLTGDGDGVMKVYASDADAVRLVGLVPAGAGTSCGGGGPACVLPSAFSGASIAGLGANDSGNVPRVVSEDGTRVNFSAPASNGRVVSTGSTANRSKLYQRDTQGTSSTADDTTVRINVSERTPPGSTNVAIYQTASADGSRVFFRTVEALTNDAAAGPAHIYMWDRDDLNDETQRLTVRATGGTFTLTVEGQTTGSIAATATAESVEAALDRLDSIGGAGGDVDVAGGPGDDDGTKPYLVTFGGALGRRDIAAMTVDGSLLTGTTPEVVVEPWVAGGGHLTVIDRDDEPADAPRLAEGVIGASEDGTRVYFVAAGQLVKGAPLLPSVSQRGIYLWEEGRITFIGSFTSTSNDYVDNLPAGTGRGSVWTFQTLPSRVTPDGGTLLFNARNGAALTGYDHSAAGCNGAECFELYVYSATADRLACASCNPTGARATVDATTNVKVAAGPAPGSAHLNRSLSDDGRRVFFSSAEGLVPEDGNGKVDAYQYDVPSGTLSLISTGKSTSDSYFLDASATGDDVFFATKQRLVGWDVDSAYDLYDARVGGGFAEPVSAPPLCTGSACQGPIAAAPGAAAAATGAFAGAGNAAARMNPRVKKKARRASRCKKRGRVRLRLRGRARCVRRAVARRVKARRAHRIKGRQVHRRAVRRARSHGGGPR